MAETDDDIINVHIIHGGGFRGLNTYIGGETKIYEDVEWVFFLWDTLEDAVKSLGYHSLLKAAFRGLGDVVTYIFFTVEDFDREFHKYIDVDNRKITIYIQCLDGDLTVVGDEGASKRSNEDKSKKGERMNLLDQLIDSDGEEDNVTSSYENSDGSYCSLSSEEEFGHRRSKRNVVQRRYKPHDDKKNVVFKVGTEFKDHEECQQNIRDWAIVNGYNIWWKKSEPGKLEARCEGDCPWMLYASKLTHEATFVIKTLKDQHTCLRNSVNRQATKDWLAGILIPVLKRHANYPAKEIAHDVRTKYGVTVTLDACYKAKWKALLQMRGTFESHYKKLRPYMTHLHQMDREEGRFLLKTRLDEDDLPVFERAYIGFSSLRKGFLKACRYLICFDACFLKSPLGGCLLAAIGKDCNGKMWPISWAVVEKECQDSWTWFFEILFEDLNIVDGFGWTFMSDKHVVIILLIFYISIDPLRLNIY